MSGERGLGTLAVKMVGGRILGWVIDSIVIAATGQSTSQWGAQALRAFANGMRGPWRWPCGCGRCGVDG